MRSLVLWLFLSLSAQAFTIVLSWPTNRLAETPFEYQIAAHGPFGKTNVVTIVGRSVATGDAAKIDVATGLWLMAIRVRIAGWQEWSEWSSLSGLSASAPVRIRWEPLEGLK